LYKLNLVSDKVDLIFFLQERDYSIFKRPGTTMFPVRYKLRWENEKAVQTEDYGETSFEMHILPDAPNRLSAFDWESYLPGQSDPFTLFSRSRTPMDSRVMFDYENGLEIQTSDWFSVSNNAIVISKSFSLDETNACKSTYFF